MYVNIFALCGGGNVMSWLKVLIAVCGAGWLRLLRLRLLHDWGVLSSLFCAVVAARAVAGDVGLAALVRAVVVLLFCLFCCESCCFVLCCCCRSCSYCLFADAVVVAVAADPAAVCYSCRCGTMMSY